MLRCSQIQAIKSSKTPIKTSTSQKNERVTFHWCICMKRWLVRLPKDDLQKRTVRPPALHQTKSGGKERSACEHSMTLRDGVILYANKAVITVQSAFPKKKSHRTSAFTINHSELFSFTQRDCYFVI